MRLLTLLTGLLLLAACGGEDESAAEPTAWCCAGTWEDCRAAIDPAEARCLDIRCSDHVGTACLAIDAESFCVWSDHPGDVPGCRFAYIWSRHESGGWEQRSSRCVPYSEPDSTCI